MAPFLISVSAPAIAAAGERLDGRTGTLPWRGDVAPATAMHMLINGVEARGAPQTVTEVVVREAGLMDWTWDRISLGLET